MAVPSRSSKTRRRLNSMAIATLAFGVASATPAFSQTIIESMERAYNYSPQLDADRGRQRATDEAMPQALAGWRPTVTINGSGGRARDELEQRGASRTVETEQFRDPLTLQLQLRQPIYDGGRTIANVDRAGSLIARGRAALTSTEQQVLAEAASAHYDLLRDRTIFRLYEENVTALERQYDSVQRRFQQQDATRADQAQSVARVQRGMSDRRLAQGNVEQSASVYLRIVGSPAESIAPEFLPPKDLPTSLEDALALALENNPDLIAAKHAVTIAESEIGIARAGLLPDVSIQGNLRRLDESDSPFVNRDTAEILLVLTMPLYEAGGPSSRVREAKQVVYQRRRELDLTRTRVIDATKRQWEALATARQRTGLVRRQAQAALEALESVDQEVRAGTRTVLDRLNAEQELLDARIAEVRNARDEAVAGFQLLSAIGGLTAQQQVLAVNLYDPRINYDRVRNRWWGTWLPDAR